jgi:hypothetical protein
MKKIIVVSLSTLALSGCFTPEYMIKSAADKCSMMGYSVGSQSHTQCTQQMYTNNMNRASANAQAASAANSRQMENMQFQQQMDLQRMNNQMYQDRMNNRMQMQQVQPSNLRMRLNNLSNGKNW